MEKWKTIKGYKNYSVSSEGRVRNENNGRILKNRYAKGYARVLLSQNNKPRSFRVHRLVAEAFLGDIENKLVDHKNRVRNDNRLENLRICDHKENRKNFDKKGVSFIKNVIELHNLGKTPEQISLIIF